MPLYRKTMAELRLAELKKVNMEELAFVICLNNHGDRTGLNWRMRGVQEDRGKVTTKLLEDIHRRARLSKKVKSNMRTIKVNKAVIIKKHVDIKKDVKRKNV